MVDAIKAVYVIIGLPVSILIQGLFHLYLMRKGGIIMNYNFEKFVNQKTEVFADTCFLMNDYFLGRFYPALEQYNRTSSGRKLLINILPSCFMELEKLTFDKDNNVAVKAAKCLEIIRKDLRLHHNFKKYTEGSYTQFGDASLLSAVISLRLSNAVNVLTQDNKLTSDLYQINQYESCYGYNIEVCRFDSYGQVSEAAHS